MTSRHDQPSSSLMGHSALLRLGAVAIGIALLWGAIAWAVALA